MVIMYRVVSCVVGRGCLLRPVHSLGKTLLAFSLLHFVLQGQSCLLFWSSLDSLGRPSRLGLPGDSISRRLSCLSLPGDLHPDPGMPGSQVATVLGRIGLPWWCRGQSVCLQYGRTGFDLWIGKIPWRRERQTTLVFLPGESHGQRRLAGYRPWGWT